MYLSNEFKTNIFAKHGKGPTDTGSTEGQVALFSARIAHLTEHLKKNRKDFSTQLSLQKLVGKRRALLAYLYNKDINRYRAIIKALELRDIIK
jgi:small subunit ribosomal protein S15